MIHTLTLNPAIDRMLYLDHLEKNITNRLRTTTDTLGGKGTHVSINLKLMGQDNSAFGICHGENGRRVIQLLQSGGITVHFNHYDKDSKETRTNYLLIEDNTDCTIIAEAGIPLMPEELSQLLHTMETVIKDGDFLIFSGDASNSPDPAIYSRILKLFQEKNVKIFLDTSGASLKECISESPYMIKPNLDELSTLVGYRVSPDNAAIIHALDSLDTYHIEIISVSLGGRGSITKTPDGIYLARPPKVNVCNTIGCGDCFVAGFVYGLFHSYSMEEIIRIATAASAATAESNSSVGFDPKRANALKNQVTIEKLNEIY